MERYTGTKAYFGVGAFSKRGNAVGKEEPYLTFYTEIPKAREWYAMTDAQWKVATSKTLVAQAQAGLAV